MIILGWIGFFFLFALVLAILAKGRHETLLQSFKRATKALLFVISFIGLCGVLVFFMLMMVVGTFKHEHVNKPTILVCNNTTVAESVNGFAYNSKGGAYEDYRNNLTYTPRQGEVCKELLKESK